MKTRPILVGVSTFILIIASINISVRAENPLSSQTTLIIMTTVAVPYDVVKSIVGSDADIESIVDSTTDIHSFDGPTSVQLNKMVNDADVIFALGIPDSEPWFQPIIDDNPSIAGKVVNLTEISVDGKPDPFLENELNEHIWMDPNIVKKMANIATSALISLDSANAASFQSANSTYQTELDNLLTQIESNKTEYFDGMKVVSNHPAFLYLFDLLGIERLAVIETKEDSSEPNPQHINNIVDTILAQTDNVTIVTNPQHSSKHAIEIAQATNSKIAILTPIPGEFHTHDGKLDYDIVAMDYISMIEYCMNALRNPINPPATIPGYGIIPLILFAIIGVGISIILVKKLRN